MKTTFIVILTVLILSSFSQVFSAPTQKLTTITQSSATYEVYVYIDKELWHFVYNEDGSLIFEERIFE
jgi:hypothetical protein